MVRRVARHELSGAEVREHLEEVVHFLLIRRPAIHGPAIGRALEADRVSDILADHVDPGDRIGYPEAEPLAGGDGAPAFAPREHARQVEEHREREEEGDPRELLPVHTSAPPLSKSRPCKRRRRAPRNSP